MHDLFIHKKPLKTLHVLHLVVPMYVVSKAAHVFYSHTTQNYHPCILNRNKLVIASSTKQHLYVK
jgi:hypothetical protein